MSEKFYRTPSGKIVLLALHGVGSDRSCSFAHMHGLDDNGFPESPPPPEFFVTNKIWSYLSSPRPSCVVDVSGD